MKKNFFSSLCIQKNIKPNMCEKKAIIGSLWIAKTAMICQMMAVFFICLFRLKNISFFSYMVKEKIYSSSELHFVCFLLSRKNFKPLFTPGR